MTYTARVLRHISEGVSKYTITMSVKDVETKEEADKVLSELMEAMGQAILTDGHGKPIRSTRRRKAQGIEGWKNPLG